MPVEYYRNKLYPLQDKVLNLLAGLPVRFYLTGGTVLSRVYLKHRFSDDLDLFLNNDAAFKEQTKRVIEALEKNKITYDFASQTQNFVRIFVEDLGAILKIDFVNDVSFHLNGFNKTKLFVRTDNPLNILSNKICALSRLDPKDVLDIIFICYTFSFNWEEIISHAHKKDVWVEPVEISRLLNTFPFELFSSLKLQVHLNRKKIEKDLQIISKEILQASYNSLTTDN